MARPTAQIGQEGATTTRAGVVGQTRRAGTCSHWTAVRPGRHAPGPVERPRDRLDAHRPPRSCCQARPVSLPGVLPHSPPSGAGHSQPRKTHLRMLWTVAVDLERRSALVESVIDERRSQLSVPTWPWIGCSRCSVSSQSGSARTRPARWPLPLDPCPRPVPSSATTTSEASRLTGVIEPV
jgi:hypothetical protein